MNAVLIKVLAFLILLTGVAAAADSGRGMSLSIRFPAFSLNPGEKVSSIKVKTSHGRLVSSCRPGRWTCEHQKNFVYCYALHPSHAVAMTGLLPEIFVRDIPDNRGRPTIEASAECLDGSGRKYTREFREDELIIK
jgi:hypothetical protein